MRPLGTACPVLVAVFLSLSARAPAQTNFNAVPVLTTLAALPGQTPNGLVFGADGNFYGTTELGGGHGSGTVFRASPAGVVTSLYSFTGGGDGGNPVGTLVAGPGGYFYGTTSSGGNTSLDTSGAGTAFRVGTNGVPTTVYTFTGGNDGDTPFGGLSLGSDGAFYGTTLIGGDEGFGAAFRVTASGAFSSLGSFDYTSSGGSVQFPDGSSPASVLVQGGDGNFYGTTQAGGLAGQGCVFQLSPTNGFAPLFSFTVADGGSAQNTPGPQLTRAADGSLYGLTFYGGSSAAQDPAGLGYGTIFRITTNGVFTEVYSFSGGGDGANPLGALAQAADGSFFGVAQNGGADGYGTIFQLGTNAGPNALKTVYTFTGGSDGGNPPAGLTLGGDGNWYGVTAGAFYRLGYASPPFITAQPASQTKPIGSTVSFSVTGGGSAPLGYQWQFDGTDLPGATGTTLVLTYVQAGQAGDYTVVLTNPAGSLTSSNAVLSLFGPPVIITQPEGQKVVAGADIDLTVTVTGVAPITYQWEFNGTNLPGATNLDLSLTNIQADQSGSYTVVAGNAAGAVTSAPAVVVVTNPPPSILTQPASEVAGLGETATFSVEVSAVAPTDYQWRFDGTNISLATNSSLVLTNAQPNMEGTYDVVVTDPSGSVTSSNATLTVSQAPTLLAVPSKLTVQAGTNVTLSVTAGGVGTLTYQWQFEGVEIGGATNAALVLTNATPGDSGDYTVVVANSYGSVTSAPPELLIVNGGYQVTTLAGPDLGFYPPGAIVGLALDAAGNAYATGGNMIWKIPADGAPTVLAGSSGTHGSADGIGKNATFYAPQGVAVDGAGNVYVSDTGNSTIRVITSNGVVSTLAGTAGKVGSINGLGPAARFSDPIGVAVDAAGNVYVADASNNSIRKITPAGLVSILAGKPGSYGNTDGPVAKALFEGPEWLAVDAAGNVYVAETGNEGDGTIRKIGTNGIVSTVAGGSGKSGSADGVGKSALFSNLGGVAVDRAGNVLVADAGNGTIRLITTNGVATTQAGVAGEPGDSDGVGNEARFGRPGGVAVDTEGNFYVADLSSVRKGISLGSVVAPSITVQPQSQTGSAGENVTFSVGVAGTTPLFYQWYGGKAKLAGATQSSYTLTNVLARNNGIYSVVVTNFAGKATSAFATFLYVAKVQPQTQTLTNAIFANGVFSVSIPSQAGINYVLEYKASLTDPVWQTVGTTAGTGGVIVLSDSGAAGSTRFYRVLIQ